MHIIGKSIAIFITATILINAMAPALVHAAKHLQGDQVNANALVRDAYIAVTYRDGNDKQKSAKGWIDAIGETSFTIRSGGLKSKTTIAYAKVLSIIMSEESSVPAKQMNEVNRFIRNTREIEQAKEEAIEAMAPLAQTANNALSEVIAGVERFIGERARRVVVAKGRYVGVTYRKDDSKIETEQGFVRAMNKTELTIHRDKREKTIPRTRIEELMVCDNPFQLLHAQNLLRLRRPLKGSDDNRRWVPGVGSLGILGGIGGGIIGWIIGINSNEEDNPAGSLAAPVYSFLGVLIGGGIGIGIGALMQKTPGQFGVGQKGNLMGLSAGTVMMTTINRKLWPSLLIGPIVGATMLSKRSHSALESRRLSIGLAPDRSGNLSAIATLRF